MRILLFSLHFLSTKALKYEFFVLSPISLITSSPTQELEPGATPYRGGRCAAAILADRCSSADNKYKIL